MSRNHALPRLRGDYDGPAFSLAEYKASGCFQFEVPQLAVLLHMATGGRMCNGCPEYKGGACPSLRKMLRPAQPTIAQPAGETVRAEAARRGLSISEVRRQRRATSAATTENTVSPNPTERVNASASASAGAPSAAAGDTTR